MKGFISVVAALILVLSVSSDEFASNPDFENFIRCLPERASPSSPIARAIYTPNNTSFETVFVSYAKNRRFLTPEFAKPLAIVTALHESHVQATVVCAKIHGIQIRIRGGGHDYEGLSYISHSSVPFVILDMFNLRSIKVDVSNKTAWVHAGATIGEIYMEIGRSSKTLAFPAGTCPTVGAGGHISGGGYGNLMRMYGISVDHVIDALIVDVNGKILNRAQMGEDLFWAIRGGGGASFGVILAWKINLVRVPETVTVCRVNRMMEHGAMDVIYKWQIAANKFPRELFISAMTEVVNGSRDGEKTIKISFTAQFLGLADNLLAIVNGGLPELRLKRRDCVETSWLNSTVFWAGYPIGTPTSVLLKRLTSPEIFFKSKSDYVKKPIPKQGMENLWKTMLKMNDVLMIWNPYGGIMDQIPASATAFPHRAGNLYKIQYFTSWSEEGENVTAMKLRQMRELYNVSVPNVSSNPREAFLNYRDIDIGSNWSGQTSIAEATVYGKKYFLGNLKRLMEVKAKYDPENFFKNEQSILPAFASTY